MKTWLITGGAGFIGSNFILYLLDKYENIRLVNLDKLTYAGNLDNLKSVEGDKRYTFAKGDICDKDFIEKLFACYDFDYVVNLAAESHVDRSIEDPAIFAKTNVMGTLTLMDAARDSWQRGDDNYRDGVKFIQVSTDEVYGSLGETGFFTEDSSLDPGSPYSASKASAGLFVKAYANTYKLPVNITCCSNNYGPFQFPEKLIPLMIHNALSHKPLPVYGDGLQVRDWLYVGDHCKAIDMVARKGHPGEVYNVGGHNEKYNIDIVKTILAYIRENVDPEVGEWLIRHVRDRKGHDRRYAIDPAKIKKDIGWVPQTAFEEGIRKTIAWYLGHRDWMERVTNGAYREYYGKMYKDR